MLTKLFITPYFGPLPDWMPLYWRNAERLREHGYDWLLDTDLAGFKARVRRVLGVECPVEPGGGKVWDYRCALGELYADETAGYDFWGHTDFDVVYGRAERWVTDDFLDGLDVHSNCATYMNGCWSLYRNTPAVTSLFREHPDWAAIMEDPRATGWVEQGYSRIVEAAHDRGALVKAYTQWQTRSFDDFSTLRLHRDGRLTEGGAEVMMAHFRRTKVYPEGCR